MKNKGIIALGIQMVLMGMLLTGEVMCIVKAYKCNWEPIGKAEIVYTVAACTGFGSIVGWLEIEDK